MKFLLQTIDGKIKYDYVFHLHNLIEFHNWYNPTNIIEYLFYDVRSNQNNYSFKNSYRKYVPIGDINFVESFLNKFYGLNLKPINIPVELFGFAGRFVMNGNDKDIMKLDGIFFIKSNDVFYEHFNILDTNANIIKIPIGNYQISEYVDISNKWRAFVYDKKLVGLQNYDGDFTKFPNVKKILGMISSYKSSPIAYSMDVFVNNNDTYLFNVNNFTSCHLYGFFNYKLLPVMFSRWFYEYVKKYNK